MQNARETNMIKTQALPEGTFHLGRKIYVRLSGSHSGQGCPRYSQGGAELPSGMARQASCRRWSLCWERLAADPAGPWAE